MPASLLCRDRNIDEIRVARMWAAGGFISVTPLPSERMLLAVGSVYTADELGQHEMQSVVQDMAMIDGHDPAALLANVNDLLRSQGTGGHLDVLAVVSRPGGGVAPTVESVGRPAPLVVTDCGQAAGSLSDGCTIVVGSRTEAEVRRALDCLAGRPYEVVGPTTVAASLD